MSDERVEAGARSARGRAEIRIALLGLGQVGSAVAELAQQAAPGAPRITICSALVRDIERRRAIDTRQLPLTTDPSVPLASNPDVVVEVLGGLEPARTLVLAALRSGTPVVTANKSLLAAHGGELLDAAERAGSTLLYEASVIAGVPFLGTFGRRPRARTIAALSGIVNGTSNFILSRMTASRASFAEALAAATRAGYAEPDPSKDLDGHDATEKLCVLLRHFGGWQIAAGDIERQGIRAIEPADLEQAAAFGGVIRPVAAASWTDSGVQAYVGPAFAPLAHPFARIDGVQNAIALGACDAGGLFFSGPGAGPAVTAATVLDDIVEAHARPGATGTVAARDSRRCDAPETGWFIRLASSDVPDEQHAPELLATLGIRTRRVSPLVAGGGGLRQWLLTGPCSRAHLDAVLDVLSSKTRCEAFCLRVLD